MDERDVIAGTDEPVTTERLVENLSNLGVSAGDAIVVHSSLSSIGWVPGAGPAVVDALMAVLTEEGTLVMPTHSGDYSDPSKWENPPVPDSWIEPIRESMPPFRPEVTPTRGMGAIVECFRCYPGVRRSRHPELSFAAWGRHRDFVVDDHAYSYALGEDSPLARVYELDGDVLLLGVGHDSNTSLHLAEYRADWDAKTVERGSSVPVDGEGQWITYEDIATDSDDFDRLGADFEANHDVRRGRVGSADATLASQRALVDFGVGWIERNR